MTFTYMTSNSNMGGKEGNSWGPLCSSLGNRTLGESPPEVQGKQEAPWIWLVSAKKNSFGHSRAFSEKNVSH